MVLLSFAVFLLENLVVGEQIVVAAEADGLSEGVELDHMTANARNALVYVERIQTRSIKNHYLCHQGCYCLMLINRTALNPFYNVITLRNGTERA